MKNWMVSITRLAALFTCLALFAACGTPTKTPGILEPTPSEAVANTPTLPEPTLTPTPEQASLLSICTGQEPTSLFIYADSSPGASAVYQAIYDGPIDIRGYQEEPVIFDQLPSLDNGGIRYESVQVNPGEIIIDAHGTWQTLAQGAVYRPSGCFSSDCALTYGGAEPVSVDRLVVRFTLKQNLTWSDGTPLSANDSVYSFEIARDLYPAYRPDLINLTQSYQALDAVSVEWRSVPGFQGGQPSSYFFQPLPRHLWGSITASSLYTSESVTRSPLGWGPYVLEEWVSGDHMTLKKNPNYFRSSEGLPAFENLVFRFVDDSLSGIDALLAGECDLIDETVHIEDQSERISSLVDEEQALLFTSSETGWEQLTFGILPYDPARTAPFKDVSVRQAAAYCIDRQAVAQAIPGAQVMDTYAMPGSPLNNLEAAFYSPDTQQAASLLESAGWIDEDSNPSTPRTNANGEPLSIVYIVPEDPLRQSTAELIEQSLEACGFQVDLQILPWDQMMASGQEGPLFGRSFDLAQFGWAASSIPPCNLYLSSEIPGPYPDYSKGWGGANASGYSNQEFDSACRLTQENLPGSETYEQAHLEAQAVFAQDLPSLPLYSYSSFALARPDLCGIDPAAGSTLLWNLEAVNYGTTCADN